MDGQHFDALVKSLARGSSRRTALRRLLGIGGAAIAGGAMFESDTEAARRPSPTPTPVKCPGSQHWSGTRCECDTGLQTCGPACCAPGSECCDNACCQGHCYGEELCCAHANWCEASGECCPAGTVCCGSAGCVDIDGDACCDGIPFDPDTQYCCGDEIVEGECCASSGCPPGFECCSGVCCATGFCCDGTCCALGCCGDACLANEGDACCQGYPYDPSTHFCCFNTIVPGECCRASNNEGCNEGFECCDGLCCPSGDCCNDTCCEFGCCGAACRNKASDECCVGFPYDPATQYCCANTIFPGQCDECCGGRCCPEA